MRISAWKCVSLPSQLPIQNTVHSKHFSSDRKQQMSLSRQYLPALQQQPNSRKHLFVNNLYKKWWESFFLGLLLPKQLLSDSMWIKLPFCDLLVFRCAERRYSADTGNTELSTKIFVSTNPLTKNAVTSRSVKFSFISSSLLSILLGPSVSIEKPF